MTIPQVETSPWIALARAANFGRVLDPHRLKLHQVVVAGVAIDRLGGSWILP